MDEGLLWAGVSPARRVRERGLERKRRQQSQRAFNLLKPCSLGLEASSLHVGVSSDSRFQVKFGRVSERGCLRLLSLEAVPDRRINGKETYWGLSWEHCGMSP